MSLEAVKCIDALIAVFLASSDFHLWRADTSLWRFQFSFSELRLTAYTKKKLNQKAEQNINLHSFPQSAANHRI